MTKNIFVLGLTEMQCGELQTIRHADDCTFHSLLDYDSLVQPEKYVFGELLDRARRQLRDFPGSVDGIIAHWDFPTSVLAPILASENQIPAPSLESILKCEHKFWSRVEQAASVPECVPPFASFDPFDDDALEKMDLDFPFWVKPVKSHSSQLGFAVHDAAEFWGAVQQIREEIGHIGDAFDEVLDMVDLPTEVAMATGTTCVAEGMMSGQQTAPEGAMYQGEFMAHGVFDMHKDEEGNSIQRLDYPASRVPEAVQQRMIDASERFLRHIGFDHGCFNVEFMWDEDADKLWLIEVNTRISQSHSDLFAKVDGMSNHEVAIDIALGQRPSMPHRKGEFAVAAKYLIGHYEDGVVTRVPSEAELAEIAERHPGTVVELAVETGDRLADLPIHDAYRYVLAEAYVGADDIDQVKARCAAVERELRFEFDPPPESTTERGAG